MTFVLSSVDARPPYGFMLLPGTTSSGLAIKCSSFSSSQMKPGRVFLMVLGAELGRIRLIRTDGLRDRVLI